VEEVFSWLSGADENSQTIQGPSPSEVERGQGEGTGEREESTREASILLAEDNADMRDYLAFLLRNAGYIVEAVENGSAALAALRGHVPDLLLSDVMMPELDGLHLLRQVRADPRTQRLPVILLSARAGEEAAIEGLALGTDDYLMKPFSARELLARVRANTELGRMREQAVQKARQHIAQLEGLYEALLAVHSTLSPKLVLDLISHEARALLGAEYALTSFTSTQEQAQALMSVSVTPSETAPFTHLPVPTASVHEDAHHQRSLKSQLDPLRERYASLQQHPTGSPYVLEAPLLQRDGSEMGTVQVVKTTEEVFGEEDRLVLLQLVQMTSIALEHGKLFQMVQDELLRQKEQEAVTSQFLALLAQELQVSVAAFTQEASNQFQRVRHLLALLEAFPFLHDEHLTLSSAEESDLVQVAREVLREQQILFPDTLLTFHTQTEPLLVRCDHRWVRFVLSALLGYVLTRPLSKEMIQVRVREDAAHGTVLVALHYQTARIEESEHLFDLSYWSRQVTSSQHLELGLSLRLSAAIIKRSAGRIWLEQQGTYQHLCFVLPTSPTLERRG